MKPHLPHPAGPRQAPDDAGLVRAFVAFALLSDTLQILELCRAGGHFFTSSVPQYP